MLLKNLPSWSRLAIGTVACLWLNGCGITYVAQAARGQMGVMRARESIDRVIAKPTTTPTLREQLLRAQRIRDFATSALALPDNGAYRSYADIHRPYVVWNVVAAPELSTVPRQWCFPVAGCVAYRGYFREPAARAFAARLKKQGDDVLVGGVAAYSTLGRIADPLLNTVAGYGEFDLAALIFHELAHQVVYKPGDSAFNEAFATVVEEAGLARYAEQRGDKAALQLWQARRALRAEINQQFIATRTRLKALFESVLSADEKRQAKAQQMAALGTEVLATERRHGRTSGYARWIDAGLNNAHLASVATYYETTPVFEAMLNDDCGGYLPCLYVRAAKAAKWGPLMLPSSSPKKDPAEAGPVGGD
jgi:predicted aminopeptidase